MDNTQNANISIIQGVDLAQNANISIIQGVDATQNANISIIQGVDATQNANISIIQGVDLAQNSAISIIQGVDLAQNANISIIQGVDLTQNTWISSNVAYFQGVDLTQNTWISSNVAYFQGVDLAQNSAISIIQGVDTTQNTTIAAVNQFAGGAYDTANNRVSSVSGTAGRISSSGGLTPAIDLVTAGPGATSATNSSVTIDAYGRVTALSSGTAPVTSITGTSNQVIVTGTTTPTLSLPQNIATSSNVQFGSFGVGTAASGTTGEIRATNNITAYYSDDRLKTRLGNIENALDKIMTLNGFYHEANETAQALGYQVVREVGVSAQEVNTVLPEVVAPAPIDPQYMTVRYERLVPLLIEAIKELKAEVEELKKK